MVFDRDLIDYQQEIQNQDETSFEINLPMIKVA